MQKGTLCFNNTWHAVISNTHDHQVPSPDGPTRWQHPHYTSSSVTYTTSCNKTSQLTRSNSETVLSAIDLLFPRKNSRSQPFSLFYLSNQYDYSFENIDPIITIHVPILFGQWTRTVQHVLSFSWNILTSKRIANSGRSSDKRAKLSGISWSAKRMPRSSSQSFIGWTAFSLWEGGGGGGKILRRKPLRKVKRVELDVDTVHGIK